MKSRRIVCNYTFPAHGFSLAPERNAEDPHFQCRVKLLASHSGVTRTHRDSGISLGNEQSWWSLICILFHICTAVDFLVGMVFFFKTTTGKRFCISRDSVSRAVDEPLAKRPPNPSRRNTETPGLVLFSQRNSICFEPGDRLFWFPGAPVWEGVPVPVLQSRKRGREIGVLYDHVRTGIRKAFCSTRGGEVVPPPPSLIILGPFQVTTFSTGGCVPVAGGYQS